MYYCESLPTALHHCPGLGKVGSDYSPGVASDHPPSILHNLARKASPWASPWVCQEASPNPNPAEPGLGGGWVK